MSNLSVVAIGLEDVMSAFALVVSGWLVFASVASPPPEASSRLPVRRVVLYGNGVLSWSGAGESRVGPSCACP